MRKATLLMMLLLSMSTVGILLGTQSVRADHDADVDVLPKYYGGGEETKIFNVSNNGPDDIVEVVVSFPLRPTQTGDVDFKPVEYVFPDGWKATYEVMLRQVIFQSLDPDNANIGTDEFFEFKIIFEDGPTYEGEYEWIITTSDNAEFGRTYYRSQWIDLTEPDITIDYPEHNSDVYATNENYPTSYFFWTNGTVSDALSGVKNVEVRVYNETFDTDWVFAAIENDHWYYKWYNDKVPAGSPPYLYTVEARAEDMSGNPASAVPHDFKYWLTETVITLKPNEGTVGLTTELDSETGWYKGTMTSYESKQLGTSVTVEGVGFNEGSIVSIYAGELLVKELTTNSTGGFITSFLFPTLPGGGYTVYAEDDSEPIRFASEEFTVKPEIIYKPVVVVGPAVIEVMATGLESGDYVDGFTIDGTDALLGTNRHVIDWETDADGVLFSSMAEKPGFQMPVLEPGTYEIGLDFRYGDSISNVLHVVNSFEDLSDAIDEIFRIEGKLDYLKPMIERIDDNVVWIRTTLGRVEGKIDDFTLTIDEINGTTVTILARVDDVHSGETEWQQEILGIVREIKDGVVIIETDIGEVKVDVEKLKTALSTTDDTVNEIFNKVTDIVSSVEDVPTQLTINIATVLSAISAIAAITAVVVVLRRLKVAA